MVIYATDDDDNIIVIFDSRWKYPELLGYKPDDPEYSMLQKLWEKATGKRITENDDSITHNHRKEGD